MNFLSSYLEDNHNVRNKAVQTTTEVYSYSSCLIQSSDLAAQISIKNYDYAHSDKIF